MAKGEEQTSGSNVPHYGAAEQVSDDDRSSRAMITAAVATFALTVLALLAVHGESGGSGPHSMAMKTVAMTRQMQTHTLAHEKSAQEIRKELGGGGKLDYMWDKTEEGNTESQQQPLTRTSHKTNQMSALHAQAIAKQLGQKSVHKEEPENAKGAKLEEARKRVNGNGVLAGYSFGLGDAVASSDDATPMKNLPTAPQTATAVDEMNDDMVRVKPEA